MPNLFSDLPVAILAWVLASTSGLTRTETCAVAALRRGDLRQQFELGLGLDVDAENALVDREREFARGLADAGEHDLVGRNAGGAARASVRRSETTSAPAPSRASVAITAWLEFAFMA